MTTLVTGDAVFVSGEGGGLYPRTGTGVVVDGTRIAEVGPIAELRARHPEATVIGGAGDVVLPGFVNGHQHGRGLTSLQLGIGDSFLESYIARHLTLPRLDPYLCALASALKQLRAGITTTLHAGLVQDWTQYQEEGVATLMAYRDAGLRVAFGVPLCDMNPLVYLDEPAFVDGLPEDTRRRLAAGIPSLTAAPYARCLEWATGLADDWAEQDLVSIFLHPLGPQWCSDDLLAASSELAIERGFGLHLHCLESPAQHGAAARLFPAGTTARLRALGALTARTSLAHGVWLDEDELRQCAETGANICHNPGSNLRLHAGVLDLGRALRLGVNLAIGTDGHTFNDEEDVLNELRLTWMLQRVRDTDPAAAPPGPGRLLAIGSDGGARALGLQKTTGQLRAGLDADLVVMRAPWTRELEVAGVSLDAETWLLDLLLARGRSTDIHTVLVRGRQVLRDGAFPHVDEDAVLDRLWDSARAKAPSMREDARRIAERMAGHYRDLLRSGTPDDSPASADAPARPPRGR